jgi:hypothetical protein
VKTDCRPYEHRREARTLFKYLPIRSTRTRLSGCAGRAQNSVKGSHLGPSNEGGRARKARAIHLAREVEVLKWHGVTFGTDFYSSWQYKGTKIRPELTFALTHTMPL